MKTCSKCKKEKNEAEFSFYNKEKNKLQCQCKECVLGHRPNLWTAVTEKACSKCLIIKPIESFLVRSRTEDKVFRFAECKKCTNRRKHLRRLQNPEKEALRLRKAKMYTKYRLRYPDYIEFLTKQEGRCKICTSIMISPCIDHCHKTGKVRGLLCTACNSGLGLFKENIKSLENAIIYIKETTTQEPINNF